METWAYSEDEENYRGSFETKERAIEEGRAFSEGEFFVARAIPFVPSINASDTISNLCEAAHEFAGDHAESWLDSVEKDQREDLESMLNEVLNKWLDKNNLQPKNFFGVDESTVECIPEHENG